MSGRKKKQRTESSPAPSLAQGAFTPPSAGKKQGAGRGKAATRPRGWLSLAVLAGLAGAILGMAMVSLSLISVATSDDLGRVGQGPSQPSGAKPGGAPTLGVGTGSNSATTPGGVAAPSQVGAQKVDPARLALRTKGDPQAPVVVTEWFDFL
jgi:hypothetical protein